MDEYIGRQKLLDAVAELKESPWFNAAPYHLIRKDALDCVVDLAIKQAPTADVRENVSAKWESAGFMAVECSNCHETFYELISDNFCPNCGAYMRDKNNDG